MPGRVVLRSDSRLQVEQLADRFKVKNPTLQRLHRRNLMAASAFERIAYEHVRRERNVEADRLAAASTRGAAGEGAGWERPPPESSPVGGGGGTAVTRSPSGNSKTRRSGPLP